MPCALIFGVLSKNQRFGFVYVYDVVLKSCSAWEDACSEWFSLKLHLSLVINHRVKVEDIVNAKIPSSLWCTETGMCSRFVYYCAVCLFWTNVQRSCSFVKGCFGVFLVVVVRLLQQYTFFCNPCGSGLSTCCSTTEIFTPLSSEQPTVLVCTYSAHYPSPPRPIVYPVKQNRPQRPHSISLLLLIV